MSAGEYKDFLDWLKANGLDPYIQTGRGIGGRGRKLITERDYGDHPSYFGWIDEGRPNANDVSLDAMRSSVADLESVGVDTTTMTPEQINAAHAVLQTVSPTSVKANQITQSQQQTLVGTGQGPLAPTGNKLAEDAAYKDYVDGGGYMARKEWDVDKPTVDPPPDSLNGFIEIVPGLVVQDPKTKKFYNYEAFANNMSIIEVGMDFIARARQDLEASGMPTWQEDVARGNQAWQQSQDVLDRASTERANAAALEMERQRILASLSGPRDWVKYQEAIGSSPVTPEWLPNWVPNARAGQTLSAENVRTPSPQQWMAAPRSRRDMVSGFADWSASKGGSRTAEDIMGHMESMIPNTPRPPGGWTPRVQRS